MRRKELFSTADFAAANEGTESLAINNTFFRRWFTILALKTLRKLHKFDGLCHPISKHATIRKGYRLHLTEAATMKFVAETTSIPVPKVHCAFVHKGHAYIIMERIHGDKVPGTWRSLPESGRQKVFAQLRTMVQELRALKLPNGIGVESCVGGSLHDSRLRQCNPRYGPFETIQDFHFWLREGFQPAEVKPHRTCSESEWADLKKMVEMQNGPWPPPGFTHADLNPFNVLICGEKVVGIIDWEFAGWLPYYCEYTPAWHGNVTKTDWRDSLHRFLDSPSSDVFDMENTRNLWWGEF